uniref:Semaphorin-3D n=1 Tax=Amazona collaria TaxID=241587 RepID=A0A8B9GG73_9PSIT
MCSTDLLKSNSSRLLLASGDGMDFQALLVDEDRAWLMVGAKNHIFLLHLDHPSREPEKVSTGPFLPCNRSWFHAGAWSWMCSELGCSNVTRDTFTPGCLNQWGQPIPGSAEPHRDRQTPGRDRARRPGRTPGAEQGQCPEPCYPTYPCCCCSSSSSEPTNVIPRHPAGGCAAPAQQKKSPLTRCSLAFPWAGIQDCLPADGRAVAHPALTLRQIPSESVCRLPAKLCQPLGTQECQSHCRAAPHCVPESGSALWPSAFPPVPLVKESRAASWGLCVADFLASLPGAGRALPAGWEECGDRVCQLHPPPPALQQDPRVRLWDRLLPAHLCLHPAGSSGEDGELYSGTSSDFMGSSAAFFRTWVHGAEQSYIRTEQNQDHWLHEPAFIGAYAIPDTYNPHDDKVYIFFRETAMEAGQWERRHIHARVARVCKNDVGGKHSLINRWSTFLKARLVCSIPGAHGTETHFDQLEDVFLLRTRDPQNPLVFGLFTVSSGVFSGSAVCVYSMAAVRAAFSGPFAHKEGFDYRWVEYKGRVPYPRPGTCPSETYDPLLQSTKDFPDEVISFMRTHQLMWEPVYPQGRQPVLARVNVPYQLRRLLVHRLEMENRHYDALFLGTDEGKVLKVGLAGGLSRGTEVISLEEISVTKVPSPILDMKLSPKRQELFVSSAHGLIQLSLYRCELYGKTCTDCCLARDPYCTWDSRTCAPHVLTEKRRARCQDVLKSDPLSQCQDTAEGTAAVEKPVFGVEKNSTFLECLARSPQTTVRWLVRHGEETGTSEQVRSNGHFSVLEQGLLIRQLAPEDAGTYECQAMERSFSRPLTRYSLRVIRHEAMELPPYKRSEGAELGGTHQSPRPRIDLHPGYKGFPRALGAPGTSLDVYCNALRLQERQRQKAWHQKWQHPSPDSKGGRVRRHRQPL